MISLLKIVTNILKLARLLSQQVSPTRKIWPEGRQECRGTKQSTHLNIYVGCKDLRVMKVN